MLSVSVNGPKPTPPSSFQLMAKGCVLPPRVLVSYPHLILYSTAVVYKLAITDEFK